MKKGPSKTYKDIEVSLLQDADNDVTERVLQIQCFLTYLANGEKRRGHLEKITSYPNIYSMRLTKKDRLVFRITKGFPENGVKALTIFSAKGHYENDGNAHFENIMSSTVRSIVKNWDNH